MIFLPLVLCGCRNNNNYKEINKRLEISKESITQKIRVQMNSFQWDRWRHMQIDSNTLWGQNYQLLFSEIVNIADRYVTITDTAIAQNKRKKNISPDQLKLQYNIARDSIILLRKQHKIQRLFGDSLIFMDFSAEDRPEQIESCLLCSEIDILDLVNKIIIESVPNDDWFFNPKFIVISDSYKKIQIGSYYSSVVTCATFYQGAKASLTKMEINDITRNGIKVKPKYNIVDSNDYFQIRIFPDAPGIYKWEGNYMYMNGGEWQKKSVSDKFEVTK
jgi:hypothetical protein